MDTTPRSPNQSVEKTLDIIEAMADEGRPMRLSDIAQRTDLPAATALRMLRTLMARRYVYQEPDTSLYSLTLGFTRIGSMISGKLRVRDAAHPILSALSRQCGESVCLAIEDDQEISYIDVFDGPDGMLKITQRIGKCAPMHCTGVGKALLSAKPPEAVERLIQRKGLAMFTPNTLTDADALAAELERIRESGFALDDEECELGARCVAAGVYDYQGICVAGISITGPSARMTTERIESFVPMLSEAAREISVRLGHRQR
ncbi:MAG: IclR family transcriptional regulator [Oscillospiraceae bacterium]|jgi:DNA-binding IclR family transcriptional regulator|nr:IclR family transcriptional regulator [Oscillospiraceae bacterium]